MGEDPRVTLQITITNTAPTERTLILEPWANEYALAPGDSYIVEGEGPVRESGFDVSEDADLIIVWAWVGSDARLLAPDGTIIAEWTGLRLSQTPQSPP